MGLFELMPALMLGFFIGLLVGCVWWYTPQSSEPKEPMDMVEKIRRIEEKEVKYRIDKMEAEIDKREAEG